MSVLIVGRLDAQSNLVHRKMFKKNFLTGSGNDRPQTQVSRPLTARPPSASLYSNRVPAIPGTASRLTTAISQRPLSRAGTALTVLDRPITQQGLSGLRTGSRGPQMRQVQDKRYFEGLLQLKIRELTTEIGIISQDIENQSREQASFLVYDKRVKEVAAELTELQGQLADYNLVVDKVNTDTEKEEVDAECQNLKIINNQEFNQLEQLFSQKQLKEQQIQQLENEVEQEHRMADNLLAAMNPALREKYSELQKTNAELQKEMEHLQQQLDSLLTKKNILEDQLATSMLKQEAVRLHHKLQESIEKRDKLIEEEQKKSTPAQEREQLLQRVKDDNAEMATMDRQVNELKDAIYRKQEELDQIEQDLEESQSERHQKYRELRKREEMMEQFLSSFEEAKEQELERLQKLESNIVNLLQQISKNLAHTGNLPSVDEYVVIKDNLEFKEGELEKSKSTVEGLTKEQQQLQQNLQKVEALEEKIKLEMETIHQKMSEMSNAIITYSDLDKLKLDADKKQVMLEEEFASLNDQKLPTYEKLKEMENKYEEIAKQLQDNETYAQLSNLERKLAQLEQNNFGMKEFIESKQSETDYEPLKSEVDKLVQDYNQILKDSLKRSLSSM